MPSHTEHLAGGFPHRTVGRAFIVHADCMEWMRSAPEDSIHAIVTDPPYGLREYESAELEKRAAKTGGIWRIPPSFDGSNRQPLPRFTALNAKERREISIFFSGWATAAVHVLRPGGHVFIATNSFLCQLVYAALVEGGLEFRGQLVRIVRTLRGGDRPKNAEEQFPDVCSLPRGSYEPWGILRKPMPKAMRLSDCLSEYGTGGLRRLQDGSPFADVIEAGRTPAHERALASHPSLKPQALLRALVYASLPCGSGTVLDPFMGSGSTLAAANALGVGSIGVERSAAFYQAAPDNITRLANLVVPQDQLSLTLA